MNKNTVYYKFIFPKYSELSGKDTDSLPEVASDNNGVNDGNGQTGEVRTLCRKCPERVITYDQLADTPENTIDMYNTSIWPLNKKREIKHYIEQWLSIPKYFDLRNYFDANNLQEGGMSLIVSHSPEINGDYGGWSKFSSTFNGTTKIVYCSLIVSSGDFFYNWTLPDEVIEKSGLRDKIVTEKFHQNWYYDKDSKNLYYRVSTAVNLHGVETTPTNPHSGGEKRVFSQHYFECPGIQFGHQSNYNAVRFIGSDNRPYKMKAVYYKDSNGNRYDYGSSVGFTQSEKSITSASYNALSSDQKGLYEEVKLTHSDDSVQATNYYKLKSSNGPLVPDYSSAEYFTENVEFGPSNVKNVNAQKIEAHNGCGYYTTYNDQEIPLTRYKYYFQKGFVRSNKIYIATYPSENSDTYELTDYNVELYGAVEEFRDLNEDLKRDFIDLEATRRILFYNNENSLIYNNRTVSIIPTSDIPKQLGSTPPVPPNINPVFMTLDNTESYYNDVSQYFNCTGKNTQLSYEPPSVYATDTGVPPLQIPYNYLRYALNDRPPYTDCETVLVMWVANSDPKNVQDGNVSALHSLWWEQYAIPVSVRCCFKEPVNSKKYCNDRFLVLYPFRNSDHTYKFHIRRGSSPDSNIAIKEALYLQDLIDCSNDYIVSYHNTSYTNTYYNNTTTRVFDIQKYLCNKYDNTKLPALYARKTYVTRRNGGAQLQVYYIKVDDGYKINTSMLPCIVDSSNTSTTFNPKIYLDNKHDSFIDKWGLDNNVAWVINDDWLITLFDKRSFNGVITTVSGVLKLVDANNLRTLFTQVESNSAYDWNNIYISSLGITPGSTDTKYSGLSMIDADSLLANSFSYPCIPLGFLDNHVSIMKDGDSDYTHYGSTTNEKVVVGFKEMFDYRYEDRYHFTYNSTTNTYDHVHVLGDCHCTAYVMDYTP